MDPLTAALTFAIKLIDLHLAHLNALSPEDRAAYVKSIVEDITAWRDFWQKLIPKP